MQGISIKLSEDFGKYKVLKLLGEGASSLVYLVNVPHLETPVALKVFKSSAGIDQSVAATKSSIQNTSASYDERHDTFSSFESEVNLMYKLSGQPNIVPLMDMGQFADGRCYISMPYFDSSIATLLKTSSSITQDLFIQIIEHMLTGLMVIHQHQLLHLDIKPANVLLDANNRVFLADFGIARQVSKPIPELASSDVYDFGKVAESLFTVTQFESNSLKETLKDYIARCIAKNPQQRPQNGQQAISTFQSLLIAAGEASVSDSSTSTKHYYQQQATANANHSDLISTPAKNLMTLIRGVLIHNGPTEHAQIDHVLPDDSLKLISKSDQSKLLASKEFQEYWALCSVNVSNELSALSQLVDAVVAQLDTDFPEWKISQHLKNTKTKKASYQGKRFIYPAAVVVGIMVLLSVNNWIGADKHSGVELPRSQDESVENDWFTTLSNVFEFTSKGKDERENEKETQANQRDSLENESQHKLKLKLKHKEALEKQNLENEKRPDEKVTYTKLILKTQPVDANVLLFSLQDEVVRLNKEQGTLLASGQYKVRVSRNGYQTINQIIDLNSNTKQYEFKLALGNSQYLISRNTGVGENSDGDGVPIEFVLLPPVAAQSANTTNRQSGAIESSNLRLRMLSNEVTNELYDLCISEGACRNNKKISTNPQQQTFERAQHPVVNVSWYDLVDHFIPWLSTHTNSKLRLPTEQEWVYAASANVTTRFSWGDSMRQGFAHCRDCNSRADRSTIAVRQFPANQWQLFDMLGNVQEWVQDCWQASKQTPQRCDQAVVRGGSWLDSKNALQLNARTYLSKTARSHTTGFRLVEVVEL